MTRTPVMQLNAFLRAVERLRHELPEGRTLPEDVWRRRHRGLLALLLGHAVGLMVLSFTTGHTLLFSFGIGVWITLFAVLGSISGWPRKVRASLVSFGLVTSSAFLVHLSGGYIEMHFHYFVMVTFLALYQDWTPFLLAVGYVVFQHGIGGVFFPHTVYNHPDAWVHPWKWAFIHALFLSCSCIGVIIAWRANETSRARIENLLNSADEGFLGLDLRGRIVFANRVIEKLTGLSAAELTGRPCDVLFCDVLTSNTASPLDRTAALCAALASPHEIHLGEVILHRQDGQQRVVEYRISPLMDRSELSGVVLTLNDITERRRAEEAIRASEERYRSVTESVNDAIISADQMGNIQFWNRSARAVFGYEEKEILGRPLTLLMPERYREAHQRGLERMRHTGESRVIGKTVELHGLRKDGGEFPLELSLSAWETKEGLLYTGIIRDITERKRAEEEIRARTVQLAAANKELEAFSYSVSHDLRAPLRHIDGFADLLHKHAAAALDEKGRRHLKTISESAKSMGRLIDDLLDFSRVGRTELSRTTVKLGQLVKDVLQELRQDTEGRHITWTIGELPIISGDPSMLRQVFLNLIGNAVKYTRTRGEARIEIDHLNGHPNELVIFIKDNGVGFDMQYADKLFGVFQRLHSTNEFEGTGIGLANVRRIIHRHGGHVWAEGLVDGGATFYFSLPA